MLITWPSLNNIKHNINESGEISKPIDIFCLVIGLKAMLCDMYQCYVIFTIDKDEIKSFLDMNLLKGYLVLPTL